MKTLAAILLFLMMWPTSASALCARIDELAKGKEVVAVGSVGPDKIVILIDRTSEVWTLVAINKNGIACVLAIGTDFEFIQSPTREESET